MHYRVKDQSCCLIKLTNKKKELLKQAFFSKLLFHSVIPYKMIQGELSLPLPISFVSKKQFLGSNMISLPLTLRATPGKTTMEGGGTHHWLFSGQKTFVGANFVQPHLAKKKFANIVLFLEDRKCGQRSKHLGKKASPIPGHTCLHFFVRLSVSG